MVDGSRSYLVLKCCRHLSRVVGGESKIEDQLLLDSSTPAPSLPLPNTLQLGRHLWCAEGQTFSPHGGGAGGRVLAPLSRCLILL